jgi:hypothetical protein
MLMSTQYGFAFLCNPKCASTSVESVLKKHCNIRFTGPSNIKHINARNFDACILKLHGELTAHRPIESFCLIRNPVDWLESWYRYRSRPELAQAKARKQQLRYVGDISFSDFVEAYLLPANERPAFARLSTQFDFMRLQDGSIGVDRIYPLERMDKVREFLSGKIGKPIEFPTKNVSPETPAELEEDLRARLLDRLKKDATLYELALGGGYFERARDHRAFQVARRKGGGRGAVGAMA